MIEININTVTIPVILGDLEFVCSVDDNSRDKVLKKIPELEKAASRSSNSENPLQDLKLILKEGFNILLGEGAFDKIYKQTPSSEILMGIFLELCEGVNQEISNRSRKDKIQKYMNNA